MFKDHLSPVPDPTVIAAHRGPLSPVALVALSALADAALLMGARSAGIGWGSSLMIAWAGGAVLTVTGLLTAAHISIRNEERTDLRRTKLPSGVTNSAFLARRQLRDALGKWDADRIQDRAQAPDVTETEATPLRQTGHRH